MRLSGPILIGTGWRRLLLIWATAGRRGDSRLSDTPPFAQGRRKRAPAQSPAAPPRDAWTIKCAPTREGFIILRPMLYPQAYHITFGVYLARPPGSPKPHVDHDHNEY